MSVVLRHAGILARLARLCQGKPCGSLWTGLCLWLASSNGYAKASPVVPCGPGLSFGNAEAMADLERQFFDVEEVVADHAAVNSSEDMADLERVFFDAQE